MKDGIRTFVALELDRDILDYLDQLIHHWKQQTPSGVRWVKTEHLHLTLKFMGETPIQQIELIRLVLADLCSEYEAFPLALNGIGAFPSWQRVRTIWIGLKPSENLQVYYQDLDTRLASLNIPSDGKKFSPHLTIGRVSDYADPAIIKNVTHEMQSFKVQKCHEWQAQRVVHYKSTLQPGGPIYTPLSKHQLKTAGKV